MPRDAVRLDFFRVDRSGPTKRLLVVAGLLVAVGASAIGAHLMHRLESGVGHLISLGGGLTMLTGLVVGFGAMAMMLFENVYLQIRDEALVLHENGKETIIPWAEVEAVDVDGRYLVIARSDGEAVRWFAGEAAKDVWGRVDDARRKAAHGLLKTSGGV
jgi:hypothetical protein